MGWERELKFNVSPDVARQLPAHPLLVLAGAPRVRLLQTRYFDTESLRLGAAGMVLRLRDSGDARVVTVKARGGDALGAERREWEWQALDSEHERLGPRDLRHALAHTALGSLGLTQRQLQAELAPRFQTRFERSAWIIDWRDARIELALDRGACVALRDGAEVAEPLCEVELEMLDGALRHAWDMAWTLAQDLPLLLGPVDKASRAAALLRGERVVVPPEPGALARDATMEQAARQWLQTACAQLAVWAERIAGADEARDVHQFRVVLRRVRTALRWLAPHLPRGAAGWLRGELRWAHQLAGLVRDADVSLQLLDAVAAQDPAAPQAAAVGRGIDDARARHRRALCAYLGSARFGRLLLALGRCGDVAAHAGRAATRRMAAQALQQDWRTWRDALDGCEALRDALEGEADDKPPQGEQAARLHRLRIASKRMRLSAERMAGLLPRKARQRYAHAGKLATALQSHLGDWHDADRLRHAVQREHPEAAELQRWLALRARQALRRAEACARAPVPAPSDATPAGEPATDAVEPLLEAPRGPASSVEAAGADQPSVQAVQADVAAPPLNTA